MKKIKVEKKNKEEGDRSNKEQFVGMELTTMWFHNW